MHADRRLGQAVARLRKRVDLTQEQLAEKVSVATETISRLERGHTIPSLARLEIIAEALGAELADLFKPPPYRATQREVEGDRLFAMIRGRSAAEVALVADIARLVLTFLDGRRIERRRPKTPPLRPGDGRRRRG